MIMSYRNFCIEYKQYDKKFKIRRHTLRCFIRHVLKECKYCTVEFDFHFYHSYKYCTGYTVPIHTSTCTIQYRYIRVLVLVLAHCTHRIIDDSMEKYGPYVYRYTLFYTATNVHFITDKFYN